VAKLAQTTVQTMGDKEDGNSPSRVSRSFKDAADLMTTRQDINVDQVAGFMGNLKQMVPGKDPAALDNRASIFGTACNLLKQRPDMNFDQVSELLKRQTQGTNPKQGNKLFQDFNNAAAGLQKGQTLDQVADPIAKQEDKRRAAEKQPDDGTKKPGEENKKPGEPEQKPAEPEQKPGEPPQPPGDPAAGPNTNEPAAPQKPEDQNRPNPAQPGPMMI
jgi:hypothetical protein